MKFTGIHAAWLNGVVSVVAAVAGIIGTIPGIPAIVATGVLAANAVLHAVTEPG